MQGKALGQSQTGEPPRYERYEWKESSQNTNLIISNFLAIREIIQSLLTALRIKLSSALIFHIPAPDHQLPLVPLTLLLSTPRPRSSLLKAPVGTGRSPLSMLQSSQSNLLPLLTSVQKVKPGNVRKLENSPHFTDEHSICSKRDGISLLRSHHQQVAESEIRVGSSSRWYPVHTTQDTRRLPLVGSPFSNEKGWTERERKKPQGTQRADSAGLIKSVWTQACPMAFLCPFLPPFLSTFPRNLINPSGLTSL